MHSFLQLIMRVAHLQYVLTCSGWSERDCHRVRGTKEKIRGQYVGLRRTLITSASLMPFLVVDMFVLINIDLSIFCNFLHIFVLNLNY